MTPEQITRLSLEIGREVTELVQRRLTVTAQWGEPTRNTAGEAWPAPGVYESDGFRMHVTTGEKRINHGELLGGRPVREDEQPVGTFMQFGNPEPTWPPLGTLSAAQKWQADVQRDADGGVAADAKRVLRGLPIDKAPPAENEEDGA